MRQMIAFATAVIISFWGMVIMRENGRRTEITPTGPEISRGKVSDKHRTISTGETVKIEDHLSPDAWTVIEFSASWCPACRQLRPQLASLIEGKRNCNLRRVDIGKWGSDIANQCEIKKLPTLWLYQGRKRVATETRDVLKAVSRLERR